MYNSYCTCVYNCTVTIVSNQNAAFDIDPRWPWPWNDPVDSRAFDVVEHRPIDFNESKRRIFDDSAATQGGSEEWKPNAYQVRPRVKNGLKFYPVTKFGNSVLSMMAMCRP